jgi:hypothetical protein
VSHPSQKFEISLRTDASEPTQLQLGIGIAFTAAILFAVLLLNASWFANVTHDFVAFYTGASIVRQGHGSKLYDLAEQARVQAPLFRRPCVGCDRRTGAIWAELQVALSKGRPALVDNHTPFEALLLAPLALLSYSRAYLVWGSLNIVLWIVLALLLRPYAPVPKRTFQYLILCFGFFPLWLALVEGQTSVVVLASFSLTFICVKRQQDFRGGLCLGLGLFKFPTVLPFAAIWLLRRKWKLIAGFASAAAFFGILSFAATGPSGVLSYIRLLNEEVKHPYTFGFGIMTGDMPTVRGMLTALSPSVLRFRFAGAAVVILSAALIFCTAWAWNRLEPKPGDAASDLLFASALVISQVASFHTLVPDLSPSLLAILLALGACQASKGPPWRHVLGMATIGLYVLPEALWALDMGVLWIMAPALVIFAAAATVEARSASARQLLRQPLRGALKSLGAAGAAAELED